MMTVFTINRDFCQGILIGNRVPVALAHLDLQIKKKYSCYFLYFY